MKNLQVGSNSRHKKSIETVGTVSATPRSQDDTVSESSNFLENLEAQEGLFSNQSPTKQAKAGDKRDEILLKCKQAIENLHKEVEQQKDMNSELQVQIEQYEQLVTQLQDDQLYS